MNIMLIDDSKIDLFVSQKIIEKVNSDCKIKTFSGAKLAIEFLKKIKGGNCEKMFVPNAVFLDINMPEMDGFQFLKEYNQLHNFNKKDIKIYMLSSSTNSRDLEKAANSKYCTGFISKPLTVSSLDKIITEYRPCLKKI